jgi:hypothetical protein
LSVPFDAVSFSLVSFLALASISISWRSLRPCRSILFSAAICSRSFLRRSRLALLAIFFSAAYSFLWSLKRFAASLLNALLFAISRSLVSLPAASSAAKLVKPTSSVNFLNSFISALIGVLIDP